MRRANHRQPDRRGWVAVLGSLLFGCSDTIELKGTVVDGAGAPQKGQRLLIVDSAESRHEATSAEDGRFTVAGVAPPYDVKVLAAPDTAQPVIAAYVYLGLTRPAVRLLGPSEVRQPVQQQGTISTTISYPACPQACSVQVWTGSEHGYGRESGSVMGAAGTLPLSVEHEWTGSSEERVGVDVLIANATFSSYSYQHVGDFLLKPGETKAIGAITPPPIGRFGPVTISTADNGVPASWDKDMQVFLSLPETAAPMYLQRVAATALVTYVPNVPGATFQIATWRNAPDVDDPSGNPIVRRSSTATSPDLPLSTPAVSLTLRKGPDMIRPMPQGALPRPSGGLAWEPVEGALTSVGLSDPVRSTSMAVYTAEHELPLARLDRLGLSLQDGKQHLELSTTGGVSLDTLVDPDVEMTRLFGDGRSITNLSFSFIVTP